MNVIRHATAAAFLQVAEPLLLQAEAENNLILGIAQGIARNPAAAPNAYLATVGSDANVLACAVHIAPFKVIITRANREPIAALARDAFDAVPELDGVTGPALPAWEFAIAWSRISGVEPTLTMRLRIHETRKVVDQDLPAAQGHLRSASPSDLALLAGWTERFVSDARVPELVDASRVVEDAIKRGRLHVWEDARPVSMAAWTGKTPNGVRINFVYTPRELRGRGYATACVKALTRQQLEHGNAFCWLYTDVSATASANIFTRIGYRPVSEVAEYNLR